MPKKTLKRTKLLFSFPYPPSYGGGAQGWLAMVTQTLKKEVLCSVIHGDVGTSRRWSKTDVSKKFAGVHITPVHFISCMNLVYIPSVSALKTMYSELKKHDIVYLSFGFIFHDIITYILARIAGTKIIFGFHAPIFHDSVVHNTYVRYVSSHLIARVDACHILNAQAKKFIAPLNKNYFLAPNYLVVSMVPKKSTADKSGHFVFVGRYAHQKGLDLLVKALRNVIPTNPSLKIDFYGSGEMENLLDDLRHDFPQNIFKKGYEKNIKTIYSEKSFVLMPSRSESMPLVMIEAMAYGVPMVTTDIPGPQDVLKGGYDSIFIEDVSVKAIEKALQLCLKMPERDYKKLSHNARKIFEDRYTDRTFKKIFIDMIHSV